MEFVRCTVLCRCEPRSTISGSKAGSNTSDVSHGQQTTLLLSFAAVFVLLSLPLALVAPRPSSHSSLPHPLPSSDLGIAAAVRGGEMLDRGTEDRDVHYLSGTNNNEFWPTMATSVRQCPAWADRTTRLSPASRWLTQPYDLIRRYAYSIDESGRRRDADRQLGHTVGVLKQGTGYGVPEWEPAWSRNPTMPSAAERPIQQRIDGWVRRLRKERMANSTNSNSTSRAVSPFDELPATVTEHDRRRAAELDRVAAYDRGFESSFYDRAHAGHPYEGPLSETTAPWFELQLAGPPHARYRLIFYGTEAVLPEAANVTEGLISTLLMLLQSVDTEPRVIVPYPGNEVDRFERLVTNLSCSFHLELDEQLLHQRGEAGQLPADETEYRGWLLESRKWQQHPQPARFVHTIQASYVQCAMPIALLSSRFLLDQHPAGPVLRLVGVQYQLSAGARMSVEESGFQRVSLPLCLLRTRRVHSALMLAKSISGPPTDVLSADMLHQWLQYHLFLGMQAIHVIDRYGSLYPSLTPYIESGLLDYFRLPFLLPITIFPWQDQQLAMTLMLHATRHTADWVWEADPDEYLSFVHPYFTDNSDTVKPPHAGCHDSQVAHALFTETKAAAAELASSPPVPLSDWQQPQRCESLLFSFFSLAERYNVTALLLLSVVMDGWSDVTRLAVEADRSTREQLQKDWSRLIHEHGELQSDEQMDAYSQRVLVGRLTWSELAASPSLFPATSILDMYPYRAIDVDNRPKWLFSPRYAIGLKEHDLQYEPERAKRVVKHKAASLFSNAGTNHNGTRRNTLAQLNFTSAGGNSDWGGTDLYAFFCASTSNQSSVQGSAVRRCCLLPSATAARDCLDTAMSNSTAANEDAAAESKKRAAGVEGTGSWEPDSTLSARWQLATHDPLFPRIEQLNATLRDVPPFMQPLPLSLAARVLHFYCLARSDDFGKACRQDWRGNRERKEEMQGDEALVKTEDQAIVNTRTAFRRWRVRQSQWVLRDQRLYWATHRVDRATKDS